ncbi:hypothetical protein SLS57_002774 [Botryosphaeria dothidea]
MKASSILLLLLPALLPTAASTPAPDLAPRDAPHISNLLGTITARLSAFNMTLNSFGAKPNLFNALSVQAASGQILDALHNVASAANETDALNDAGSAQLVEDVEHLRPHVVSALNNVVAKKPAFDGLLLSALNGVVEKGLQDMKRGLALFSEAIAMRMMPQFVPQMEHEVEEITRVFDKTLAVYT